MRLLDPRLGPATSNSAQRLTFLQLHTPSMWPTARDKDGCSVVYTNVEQYACRGASSRAVEQTFVWILETVCNELDEEDKASLGPPKLETVRTALEKNGRLYGTPAGEEAITAVFDAYDGKWPFPDDVAKKFGLQLRHTPKAANVTKAMDEKRSRAVTEEVPDLDRRPPIRLGPYSLLPLCLSLCSPAPGAPIVVW